MKTRGRSRNGELAGGNGLLSLPLLFVRPTILLLATAFLALLTKDASAAAPSPDLARAHWIWSASRVDGRKKPTRHFRKSFELPARPTHARILLTADNIFDLHVNGKFVGRDGGYEETFWRTVESYDLTDLLTSGTNVIAVRVRCLGGQAGWIGAVRVDLADRGTVSVVTDRSWRWHDREQDGWTTVDHDDKNWKAAVERASLGGEPWGRLELPQERTAAAPPAADFAWPTAAVLLEGNVPFSPKKEKNFFRIGRTRAYYENDIPSPAALGRRLYRLAPVSPDGRMTLLHDAGRGVLGSPSVSWDGKTVYFTSARDGDPFFRVCRIGMDGTGLRVLTHGPFHDYDPQPLPDGRIVFSSTRIGSRDEYHGNIASSLFTMNTDGSGIRPLTYHIVGDREPRVTADGSLVFVRSDIFLQRAKVETLLFTTRSDGTGGRVVLGANRGAIGWDDARAAERNASWLRHYGYGSPAPLPDGSLAAISRRGLVLATPAGERVVRLGEPPFDIAPLPDGRLLCTLPSRDGVGVIDVKTGALTVAHRRPDVHSVTYAAKRAPPVGAPVRVREAENPFARRTGQLLCANVFNTRQTEADMSRVRAVRIFEGRPLVQRSVRHHLVHIGVEAVELGAVPLAPDGSFFVEAPADRALALQAIDAEGRSVVNEMTWIYVRPDERRSCTGCHAPRHVAPRLADGLRAASAPPLRLTGEIDPHRFRGNNAANGGVLNLQLDRMRETASIDLYPRDVHARADGIPSARSAALDSAIRKLKAPDAARRSSAARRLGLLRDRRAQPALVAALGDASADVRVAAGLALASCGGREPIAALLGALDDRHPLAAQAAYVALEHLTGTTLPFDPFKRDRADRIERLREQFDRPDWTGIEASLIAKLRAQSSARRIQAAQSLGHVAGQAGRTALRETLTADDGKDLRFVMALMRALGQLRDESAVPILAGIVRANIRRNPGRAPKLHEFGWLSAPGYHAATAAEALGRIGSEHAEAVLIEQFPRLLDFWTYTWRTGDHDWLRGCHVSPVHFRFIEALDAMESKRTGPLTAGILRSLPIDPDRGLLLELDACEALVRRVVLRSGQADAVIRAALGALGQAPGGSPAEPQALRDAVRASPPAREVKPMSPESRAAQVLSIVCTDQRYAPAIRRGIERWRGQRASRQRSYVLFYLLRTLGDLRDGESRALLRSILVDDPPEAKAGRPTPPSVYLYKAMPPFYRAAAARALGRTAADGDAALLMRVVADLDNAISVRHAAACALGETGDASVLPALREQAKRYPEVATGRALTASIRRIERRAAGTEGD